MYTESELSELEAFFKSLPPDQLNQEIEVMQSQKVVDIKKFYQNNLRICRAYTGSKTFQPAYDRLVALKMLLEK